MLTMGLRPSHGFILLALAALGTLSCGGPVDPSQNHSESLSGTINPSGVDSHSYPITTLGEYSVTITSLTPGGVNLGVGFGQPNADGTCAVYPGQSTVITPTGVGRSAITGQIVIKATYCVVVFDPAVLGTGATPFSGPQQYSGTFSHP